MRMNMSSLCGILRRSLSTSSSSDSTTTIKSFLHDLYNQRDLQVLVHNFKKASEVDRFRAKHGIYERTVRRLFLAKRFQSIEDILEHQKNYKDISKEGFSARIISLYGRSGMFQNAHKMFDEMPQWNCSRTVLSFNALLGSYLHSNKYDMVQRLFFELPPVLSVDPNLVSYNTLIKAFCEMGSFDSAISVLGEMEDKGVRPNLITFNILLDGLYAKGRFEDGEKIWNQMEGNGVASDVRSYNAKLLGMVVVKKINEAVGLLEKMGSEGVEPDLFSINVLIKGFVDEDNLDEAKKWYSEIAHSGFDPDRYTFTVLLPFLCEKGDLRTAFEVSRDIFNCRHSVGPRRSLLQLVVDRLVDNSMISEAEEIVKLGKTSRHYRYKLNLPADKDKVD